MWTKLHFYNYFKKIRERYNPYIYCCGEMIKIFFNLTININNELKRYKKSIFFHRNKIRE